MYVCDTGQGVWELLSMAEVLQHLVSSYKPLKESSPVGRRSGWKEGELVAQHSKACVLCVVCARTCMFVCVCVMVEYRAVAKLYKD